MREQQGCEHREMLGLLGEETRERTAVVRADLMKKPKEVGEGAVSFRVFDKK